MSSYRVVFLVDVLVPRRAMCSAIRGKQCFIIKLVVWACDVTHSAPAVLFPASKSGSSARSDDQGEVDNAARKIMFNLITQLGLG